MSILTSPAILDAMDSGHIVVDPYEPKQLNPNSYNVRLHNTLRIYLYQESLLDSLKKNGKPGSSLNGYVPFDPKAEQLTVDIKIPKDGLILYPGILYLGRTAEYTMTKYPYVPMLEGRSSWGRLGLTVHITAGFGDVGYAGTWTLEMACVHPIIIYPNMEIAQLYWAKTFGDEPPPYNGKYQNEIDPLSSKIHEELNR